MSGKNPHYGGTFAERKAIREGKPSSEAKAVEPDEFEAVENKAASPKKTSRKTTRRG